MVQASSVAHLVEDRTHGAFFTGAGEPEDRLPNHFPLGISEDAFRGSVPTGDRSLTRQADDGIIGALDERSHALHLAILNGGNEKFPGRVDTVLTRRTEIARHCTPPGPLSLVISHAHVPIGINAYAGRLHAVTFSTDGLPRAVQPDVPMDGHTDERIQLGCPTIESMAGDR